MKCKNHSDIDAAFLCCSCGAPLCQDCQIELNNKFYCRECTAELVENSNSVKILPWKERKNKFLTFLFSCIPGGGYMYLGLLKKGTVIMSAYFTAMFAVMLFSDALGFGWPSGFFTVALSIVFIFYSIFDSQYTANEINSGMKVSDINTDLLYAEYNKIKEKILYRKRTVGIAFIVMGSIGTINLFDRSIRDIITGYFNMYYHFSLAQFVVPVLFIVAGFILIKKGIRES